MTKIRTLAIGQAKADAACDAARHVKLFTKPQDDLWAPMAPLETRIVVNILRNLRKHDWLASKAFIAAYEKSYPQAYKTYLKRLARKAKQKRRCKFWMKPAWRSLSEFSRSRKELKAKRAGRH